LPTIHPEPLRRLSRHMRIILRMVAKSRSSVANPNCIEFCRHQFEKKGGLTKVKSKLWKFSASSFAAILFLLLIGSPARRTISTLGYS